MDENSEIKFGGTAQTKDVLHTCTLHAASVHVRSELERVLSGARESKNGRHGRQQQDKHY